MHTRAAARLENQCMLRHSSRNFPLKLSLVAFCQGFPGAMKALLTPQRLSQPSTASEMNSGPLSECKVSGAPQCLKLVDTYRPSDGRGAGGVPRADDSYDLVIDGLLGYSLDGAPRDLAADMIRWTRRSSARVLALDTPSGVDASSGAVFDPALRAITRWRRRWSGR